jgi:putative N6-adenine-specific DNA methylase
MSAEFEMIAKTFRGLEEVLANELINLGANNVQLQRRAVSFTGNQSILYKANLYCRTASRILKPIATFDASNPDEVYDQVKKIVWSDFLSVDGTFAVDSTVFSDEFRHTKFVAYRVKDAIADWFTEKFEKRPSVRLDNPQLMINIHIANQRCTLSLDSSGESLHKRGYRVSQTEAPLNEALAAGMILMSGWQGESDFVDPMCGSGTLLIEAALIALNIPPGIYRSSFAFEKWKDFDESLFETLYNDDSYERIFNHKIYGSDNSPRAIKIAEQNIKSAGLNKYIQLNVMPFQQLEVPSEKCIMVTNPPYGERITSNNIFELYSSFGRLIKHKFTGSSIWVISSHEECVDKIGLKPSERIRLLNGALDCWYCKYDIFAGKRNDFVASKKAK